MEPVVRDDSGPYETPEGVERVVREATSHPFVKSIEERCSSRAQQPDDLRLHSIERWRIRLATLGLVQYINPTLQFFVAVLVFAEPFTAWHAVAFPTIWIALALYSAASWSQDRAARSRATSAGTVS